MSNSTSPKQGVCDNCPAGFLCTRLKSAINVLKSKIDHGPAAGQELDEYYKTLLALERKGWQFPNNCKHCEFESPAEEVKFLTDELIKVIR